ncbi:hypothetical protein B2J86_08150 [Acidovorax sp. SRB_14]|uniref:glycoside hydrolase family 25 protein n=1 Tax=Acidovorax sp. SRB_14 TaxID=1962699 RepID=UPI00156464D0|nr:GH25 family lysozyme [Acidovorax sp. SRB_14]NMM80896.1 hypothetical protein [Acidovorax sp. SRB_14]
MRKKKVIAVAAIVLLATFAWAQPSAEPTWVDLVDDLSRSQLARYELLQYTDPGNKEVVREFVFPEHANDGVYGVDVSHHNGQVPWTNFAVSGVKFVYIKASQGANFRDPKFEANWRASADAGIIRGAYHFLTAGADGAEQAKNYLALVTKSGGFAGNDLTPVLDLEWDFEKVGDAKVDRWSKLPVDEIVRVVKAWLDTVEGATGRRPMIYTAASWWNERMAGSLLLKDYPHWIADYRQLNFKNGAPLKVMQHDYLVWQFTDVGAIGGAGVKFDVNKLKGKDLGVLSGK